MQINGIDISEYKAKLLEREIGIAETYNNNTWNERRIIPYKQNEFFYSYKKIKIKFDIITSSTTELEECKSKLTKALENATVKFSDIDMNYTGYYVGTPSVSYITKNNDTLEFTFYAYAWKDEKTININKVLNGIVKIEGTANTPCIISVTPLQTRINAIIKINNRTINIQGITANKTIILDGVNGTFTESGVNKFSDIDLWEMPYLDPGENTISIDNNTYNISVKYKNIYI